jgi:hypothetical protein
MAFTLDKFAASVKWMIERYAPALPRRAAG